MTCKVTLQPSGRSFLVARDEPVLAAAIREGIGLPYGCRDGACGSCKSRLLEGRVAELSDIVLAQGRDLDGSLAVLDNARDESQAAHDSSSAALRAERARADIRVEQALRERDAAHAAALAERDARAAAAAEKAEFASALVNSRLRQAADKQGEEVAKLTGEQCAAACTRARRRLGARAPSRSRPLAQRPSTRPLPAAA